MLIDFDLLNLELRDVFTVNVDDLYDRIDIICRRIFDSRPLNDDGIDCFNEGTELQDYYRNALFRYCYWYVGKHSNCIDINYECMDFLEAPIYGAFEYVDRRTFGSLEDDIEDYLGY